MIMKQRISAAIALGFCLTGPSPAWAADKETRQMMADLRILQEQSQQLQILMASLNDALKAVTTRIDQQTEASRKAFADQKATIDTLASDLRVVRDRVDDTSVRIGSVSQEVEALRHSVELLNAPPPAPPAAEPVDPATAAAPDAAAPPALVAPAPVPPPPVRSAAVGMSPQRLWDEAIAMYWAGQNDLAVMGFESYIKSFPTSDRVDDAQLQIGNSYLQAGQYDKAVEAYDVAIRTYPTSNVVPEAYFRKGVALQDLRQFEGARDAFEAVVKKFPDSDASTLARQRLQRLSEVLPAGKKP